MKHKPCPFCGCVEIVIAIDDKDALPYKAWCCYCGASTYLWRTRKEAWAAWDRRKEASREK